MTARKSIDSVVEIVNMTGHPLTIGTDRSAHTFPSRGRVRADPHIEVVGRVTLLDNGQETGIVVPLLEIVDDEVRGLPPLQDDTLYIVSGIVEQHAVDLRIVSPARLHKERGVVIYARALMRHG